MLLTCNFSGRFGALLHFRCTCAELRAVLPPDLAARVDLGRLATVPASFVDEALQWRYSDLLFTAPLDGRDAYVYLLVEHQSSLDPLMAFRMLRYVTRIWDPPTGRSCRLICPGLSSCSMTWPASTARRCATET
jgi:hypothetical protein